MVRVKICGITNRRDAEAAVAAGADALGFILWPGSKRYLEAAKAGELAASLPPFVLRVAVTVNLTKPEIERIEAEWSFDGWQLHGDEPPEACTALRPRRIIKALRPGPEGFGSAEGYAADAFLLDAPSSVYGGSGRTFDWKWAEAFREATRQPVILAGGLTPENVADAIRQVRPYAVDVVSGVEAAPGRKDAVKIRDFIQAARAA
jgi:phosphoribosylanthranilate isomerase